MRETARSEGSTGETRGGRRGERMGGEVSEREGDVRKGRGERDYLCIQEHCTVVSTANKETKKLANVGNRCHSCQWKKKEKTNVPGKKKEEKKTGEKVPGLVILITRQNTDVTPWPSTFTHDGLWK